jgi:prevent-host-death family protein
MHWSLPHAQRQLRALVRQAQKNPQTITEHGEAKAVLLSVEQYQALIKQNQPDEQPPKIHQQSLVEILQSSPHRDIDLTPERSKETGRDVTFE